MSIPLDSNWPAALAFLTASLWTAQATAQPSAVAAPPPVNLQAPADAAPTAYRSALEGYQSYADEKMLDWTEANNTVARIGGWRAYAREASQSQAPADSTQPDPGATPTKP